MDHLDTNIPKKEKFVVQAFIEPIPLSVEKKMIHDFLCFLTYTEKKHEQGRNKENPSIIEVFLQNKIDYRKGKVKKQYGINFLIEPFKRFRNINKKILQKSYNKSPYKMENDNIRIIKTLDVFNTDKEAINFANEYGKDKKYKLFVAPMGFWTEFNPPVTSDSKVVHREKKMNELMQTHIEQAYKNEADFKRRRNIIQQYEIAKRVKEGFSKSVAYDGQLSEIDLKSESIIKSMKKNMLDITDEDLEFEYNFYDQRNDNDLIMESKDDEMKKRETDAAKQLILDQIHTKSPAIDRDIMTILGLYKEFGEIVRKNIIDYIKNGNYLTLEHLKKWEIDEEIIELSKSNQNKAEMIPNHDEV